MYLSIVTYKIAMKNLFLLFLIPIQFVSYNVFSQSTFETTIGGSGEEVSSKSIYSNGKIYIAGHTTSIGSGSYDIVFTRLDGNGNLIGSTIAGLAGEDISLSAAVTNKNEFILTGYTNSLGMEKPFAMKYDSLGNVIWSKYYNVPGWGEDIATLPNGDFYFTGYVSTLDYNVLLTKCDSSGNVIWAKAIGDLNINEGRKITVTEDEGALVTGITQVQAGGPSDLFVIKTDKNGNVEWSKKYATSDFFNWDLGYAIQVTSSEIIVGCLSYNQAFNSSPNSPDGLIIRLNPNGSIIKAIAFGSSEYEDIRDLEIMNDGRICFTGATNYNTHGQTDVLFAITDTAGNLITQRTFGGNSYDHGLSIKSISNNDFLIGGYSESLGNGASDMYIIRTDTSGTGSCNSISGNIASAFIQITDTLVFDTMSISVTGSIANFIVTNQTLPQIIHCSTTESSEIENEIYLSAFPNPFTTNTVIHMEEINSQTQFFLYDILGNEIMLANMIERRAGEFLLDGNALSDGMYFCVIRNNNSQNFIKLIKQ